MVNKMGPVHPGEVLKDELEELELSANAFAKELAMPVNRITSIINGTSSINADIALRLSQFFGTTPEFWLDLQSSYDLKSAMQKYLIYIAGVVVRENLTILKLRAVTAEWVEKDHKVCISFYFNGPIIDEDRDEASDICGGIIAHFPDALLEEHYIRLDYPHALPDSNYLAYTQEG